MSTPRIAAFDPRLERPSSPKSKRLSIGDRVRLSEDGCEHYPGLAFDRVGGEVVAFARKPGYLRVKLDTAAGPRQFHERDWERDPTARPPADSAPASSPPMSSSSP